MKIKKKKKYMLFQHEWQQKIEKKKRKMRNKIPINFFFLQYLGSTVVKELRGTESTRKSIQKLKQDQQHTNATNMLMSSQSETNAARNQSFNKQKRILVSLAISHRGVEFIDVNSKVGVVVLVNYFMNNFSIQLNVVCCCCCHTWFVEHHLWTWNPKYKLCMSGCRGLKSFCLYNEREWCPLLSCVSCGEYGE